MINPLVVHDDVRQHVFWVPRLHDPALFAVDWIADYYQSQAPAGYLAVYWGATLAVDAVLASKPLPLVLTVSTFARGWALWFRAEAAALGVALLAWSAWQYVGDPARLRLAPPDDPTRGAGLGPLVGGARRSTPTCARPRRTH